jgi:hypothetical protein
MSPSHRNRVIQFKDNQERPYIHQYNLKIETKQMDTEAECERLILKQLQLFHSLVLQADGTTLIPPYLILNCTAHGFKDLSTKTTAAMLKGIGTVKRYFHRLFPRQEGGQFYCNVILATSKTPANFCDAITLHLCDNRMGLWQHSIDAEQVTEIGWLLYSSRQQDDKRVADLLTHCTGEKIGAHWRLIQNSINVRSNKGPHDQKKPEVRALHLECDSMVAQHAKHKIARLYSSNTTSFPDRTKMRLIPPISTIISQQSKAKYGLVVAKQEAFTAHLATGTSWEFSQNLLLDHV